MKTLSHILVVSCLATIFGSHALGQGFSLTSLFTPTPTATSCDTLVTIGIAAINNTSSNNDYNLTLNGSNFGPSQLSCSVNWGDGTSSTYFGSVSTAGVQITWNGLMEHTYYTLGQHIIIVSVTNPQNNTTVTTNLYYLQTACSGQLNTYVTIDCNNDGIPDSGNLNNIPVNYTGAAPYQTTTNSQGLSQAYYTSFGNFTASINPNWLASNNYVVSSASTTALSINGTTFSDTAYIMLNCNTSAQQGMLITALTANPQTVSQCDNNASISTSVGTLTTSSYADFHLTIGGGPFSATQMSMSINWGDGSTSVHTGTALSMGSAIQWTPAITHNYANLGMYTILATLTNTQNGTAATTQMLFNYALCSGSIGAQVALDCNNDGSYETYALNNVPLIYSLNGVATYYDNTGNGLSIIDTALYGNYSVTIDPSWLNANNYVLANSGQYTTTINNSNTDDTLFLIINCASVSNLCISGYLFCDANNNGVFNSGENYLSNAPVQINNNGVNYTVYTNANGYYTLSYPGIIGSPTVVSLNSNWLFSNGYTSSSMVNTVLAAACGTANSFSIPVTCGSVNPNLCAAALVFCDANGNGMMDANEDPIPFAPVSFYTQTNMPVTAYSDSSGFVLICGNYFSSQSIVAQINANWLTNHGYTISNPYITIIGSTTTTPNPGMFAINCNGTSNLCADLWTTVTPWIGYYQNSIAHIKLSIGNYGPGTVANAVVTMTFPAGVTVNTSSISLPGYSISGNTITWNLSNLNSNYSFVDVITFNVPGGLINGAQHFYTSTIAPSGTSTDCYTGNNAGSLLQILGNSYDPNDKTVDHQQYMSTVEQNSLTYNVRFQNTGTAPAQNIFIIDTLSSNLDWNTFELLEASHPIQIVDLGNGIKRFEFNSIWLPDSTTNEPESHGNLVYRIKELASNQDGSEIYNTAYIYFDWNAPIVTNTTYNINTSLGLKELVNEFSLAPNPAHDKIYIECTERMRSVQILDLSGKRIQRIEIDEKQLTLPLTHLTSGVYFISVETDKGITTKKFIKE